jgi:hypothetical protein
MSRHHHTKLAALHETLLHGRLPRNLHWSLALELIASVGRAEATSGDEFAFVVGTQREFFRRPHGSELGVEEVSRLRRFLKAASEESAPIDAVPPGAVPPGRMVVVIDHHAAHVFRDMSGSRPQDGSTIEPYDPHHFHRHLVHRKEAHYRGDRVPEDTSFYEDVAKALVPAQEIVLIGHGSGKSSAVDALVEYLKKHRPDVLRHVVATEIADLSALTAPDIEAIARRHLITAGRPAAS